MKISSPKLLLAGSLTFSGMAQVATTFAQTPFSTISGKVWQDSRLATDGIMDSSEPGIPGVLVVLYKSMGDEIVMSSTISREDGTYTVENFAGIGDYFLRFHFPEEGYDVTSYRTGADNDFNNAVSDLDGDGFWRTEDISFGAVDEGAEVTGYNLGLVMQTNKIVYSTYKSSTSTEWNDTMRLPKSDASVGVLSRVKLFLTDAAHHPSIGIENISTTSGSTGSIELGGKIVVTPPNGVITSAALNATTAINKSGIYPVFDGTIDYDGASGDSWFNEFGAAYDDYNYPLARKSDFEGSDSVKLPLVASSTVTISGGGNLSSNVTTFVSAGVFVIYEYDGGVLPVTLSSFEAKKENNTAQLYWTTSSEQNNLGFIVQRSVDGKQFTDIGFVNTSALDGNSTESQSYSFEDIQPLRGENIYRLMQSDIDGKKTLSAVRTLNFDLTTAAELFPNPAYETVSVYAHNIQRIVLLSVNGMQVNAPVTMDTSSAFINVRTLAPGIYSVKIYSEDGTSKVLRFVKK